MRFPHPMPSEQSTAGDFARQLAGLLGPAYQPADGTIIAAELLALGGAVRDGRQTNLDAVNESFPDSASQTLDKWEQTYGLPVREDLPDLSRQRRLVAKRRAARSAAPKSMLLSIHSIDPTATIRENVAYTTTTITNPGAGYGAGSYGVGAYGGIAGSIVVDTLLSPRAPFVFAVVIQQSTFANADSLSQIRSIVEQMKPGYTLGNVCTNSGGFFCDDPNSLVDRDVLGS